MSLPGAISMPGGRFDPRRPKNYVDSGFVTLEGEPIFVPVEDMNMNRKIFWVSATGEIYEEVQ
jgi:hypothetical protein